jgi:hypothetical protein
LHYFVGSSASFRAGSLPNPALHSDPACIAFRSLSSFCFLGFVQRLGAGGAGELHSLGSPLVKIMRLIGPAALSAFLSISICCNRPVTEASREGQNNVIPVMVPTLRGFVDVSNVNSVLRKRAELFLPSDAHLIAFLIPEEDSSIASTDPSYVPLQYIFVSEPTNYKNHFVTQNDFSKYRAENYRPYKTIDPALVSLTQDRINSFSEEARRQSGLPDYKLKIGEVKPIETFENGTDFFAFLGLMKAATTIKGVTEERTMACCTSGLFAENHIINISTNRRVLNPSDIEWVKDKNIEFSKLFLKSH